MPENTDWDPPIPFQQMDVPSFPVEVLPGWIADFVQVVSRFSQTPVDLAGLLGLASLSTTARGGYDIEAPLGHREPLCLFVAAVLPPGERKSSVFQAMTAPIVEFETAETQRFAPQIAEEVAHRDILGKRLENLKTRASKQDDPAERKILLHDAQDLASEIAKLPPIPSARLLADDSTPEALIGLLAAHGGNIALLSAEGGLFDIIAGLYGDGRSNIDGILKAHDGEPIRVDRRSRSSEHIPRAVMTIGLAVQPAVIEGIMSNTRFRGRGLTARFLFAVPASRVGHRVVAVTPPPAAVCEAYRTGLCSILKGAPSNGVAVLRCSPNALAAFDVFRRELEPRLDPDNGDLSTLGDFAGKLPGTLARVAGLFHLVEHGARAGVVQITEDIMLRDLTLGPYFIKHARAAFGAMGADPAVAGARRILVWIQKNGLDSFSIREAFNSNRGTFPRVDDLWAPIALLEDHNCIRRLKVPSEPGKRGRKPSPQYEVSPYARITHNPQNTPEPAPEVISAYCAYSAGGSPIPVDPAPPVVEHRAGRIRI